MDLFCNIQSYDDIDDFSERVTWDIDLKQLGAGKFRADLISFGDVDTQIGETVYNKALLQHGSVPDGFTFAVHHPDSAPINWRYMDFPANGIIVFPENNEHQGVSQPNHHPFTVSFSETFLSSVAEELGLPELNKFVPKGKILLCDPADIRRVQEFLGSLCAGMKLAGEEHLNLFLGYETKRKIARLLLLALASSKNIKLKKRQLSQRKRVVDRVLEYVDVNLDSPLRISELCSVGGVDERTLRNIFYEQFSQSPIKYFKCNRLNAVRSALKRIDAPKKLIIDIANENGFWHMGQFAKDYKKLFGELPSTTLKKTILKETASRPLT